MKLIPIKANGDFFEADECNSMASEEENIVETSGQILSASDNFQISKAAAIYVAAGDFYQDSGTPNSYILSAIGTRKAPVDYIDGMRVRFKAGNTNTGASTVNINSLGVKNIKNRDGSVLGAGEIGINDYVDLVFEESNDYFVITNRSDVSNNIPFGIAVESSSNVYTLDLGGVYSAYDDRMYFRCRFSTNSTGAVTLNVEGLGAHALIDNGQSKPLIGGEIETNKVYLIAYSSGSSTLRILNRITTKNDVMDEGASTTMDVTPFDVARVIQENNYIAYETAGSGNEFTIDDVPPISNFNNLQEFTIRSNRANTGNATLKFNAIAAKPWHDEYGDELPIGFLVTSGDYHVIYHSGSDDFRTINVRKASEEINGTVKLADSGDVKTGSDAALVSSVANMKYHKGMAAGYARISTGGSLVASYGVITSTSNISTGIYRVNLSMPDSDYIVQATCHKTIAGGEHAFAVIRELSTSSFDIHVFNDTGLLVNPTDGLSVVIFGNIT